MSVQAMSWVIEQAIAKGKDYLVLLMVANRADEEGASAWPSVEWLAKRARLSERTVQRSLRRLEAIGQLYIERGAGPRGTNLYHIVMQPQLFHRGDKLTPRPDGPNGVTAVSPDPSLSVLKRREELARLSARSSPPCGKVRKPERTPHQIRYAAIGLLAAAAEGLLRGNSGTPGYSRTDLAEDLKVWAAEHDVPYSDACPGADSPIQQAITIAERRNVA